MCASKYSNLPLVPMRPACLLAGRVMGRIKMTLFGAQGLVLGAATKHRCHSCNCLCKAF